MLEKCVNYVSKLTEIMHPIVIKKIYASNP